jgi:hypothetical protein
MYSFELEGRRRKDLLELRYTNFRPVAVVT